MKISKIRIHNYRAFYPQFDRQNEPKPYEINTKDKNVLIYGENGAGKTSLFRAIRDFLNSSQQRIRYESNRFAAENNDGDIELTFTNGNQALFTNKDKDVTTGQDFLKLAQKASGLLSYVQIIKTYFYDATAQPNLFGLIVNQILAEHILPGSYGKTVFNEWDRLNRFINEPRRGKTMDSFLKIEKDEYGKETKTLNCDTFNIGFKRLLTDIEPILNDWLTRYFNNRVAVKFDFIPVVETINETLAANKRELSRQLRLSVRFNDSDPITHYHDFLNEARLSSLAICIFLASLRTYPKDENRLNVLYLDDVFIGLDMSNRLPLLDILRNEFSDYQIFLSTYDRAWFEVATRVVTDWQTVEMYTTEQGDNGQPGFCERPVIITPSDDHYSKARKYYDAKDYPASANYLRKELEQQIKNRLAEEDVRTYNDKHKTLQWFWDRMVLRYDTQGKPIKEGVKDEFNRCKLTIFNPMSHDALSFPVYRAELDKAFRVTEEIRNLETLRWVCILKQGMLLTYHDEDRNYSLTIELAGDWWLTSETIKKPLECVKANVQKWTDNKGDYFDYQKDRALTNEEIIVVQARVDKLDKIFNNIVKSLNLNDVNEILISTQVEGYVLKELLTEANGIITRPSLNFLMR